MKLVQAMSGKYMHDATIEFDKLLRERMQDEADEEDSVGFHVIHVALSRGIHVNQVKSYVKLAT